MSNNCLLFHRWRTIKDWEAATRVAERDADDFNYYSAYRLGGGDYQLVQYTPDKGIDPDPPMVAIG